MNIFREFSKGLLFMAIVSQEQNIHFAGLNCFKVLLL